MIKLTAFCNGNFYLKKYFLNSFMKHAYNLCDNPVQKWLGILKEVNRENLMA